VNSYSRAAVAAFALSCLACSTNNNSSDTSEETSDSVAVDQPNTDLEEVIEGQDVPGDFDDVGSDEGSDETSPAEAIIRDCPLLENDWPHECPDAPAAELRNGWYRVTVPDAVERNAVCNDGCPYAFYIRPGTGDNANRWNIFMKGGAGCSNVSTGGSCYTRWCAQQHYMTARSRNWRPTNEGIYDIAEENPFAGWTTVYLHYCSSDMFNGNALATADTGNLAFRGSEIVRASIEALQNPADVGDGAVHPDLDSATDIVLSGGSAGAAGVRHNIDWLAETFPDVHVVGISDSAISPQVIPLPDGALEAAYQDVGEMQQSVFDASCIQDAPEDERVFCANPDYVMASHITTRMFLLMDQFDANAQAGQGIAATCTAVGCDQAELSCNGTDTCMEALCFGDECSSAATCAGAECHESLGCFGRQCDEDDDCQSGLRCDSAICQDLPASCLEDGDCEDGFYCSRAVCRPIARPCETHDDCDSGDTCETDTNLCVFGGCSETNPCGEGQFCMPRRETPYSQAFAREIRAILSDLPDGWGAFSSRTGTHTVVGSSKFFDVRVRVGEMRVNAAMAIERWFLEEGDEPVIVIGGPTGD